MASERSDTERFRAKHIEVIVQREYTHKCHELQTYYVERTTK